MLESCFARPMEGRGRTQRARSRTWSTKNMGEATASESLVEEGESLLAEGHYTRALAAFDLAIEQHAADFLLLARAKNGRADCLARLGRWEAAGASALGAYALLLAMSEECNVPH
jgi:Flp pilus assembly protein TadD